MALIRRNTPQRNQESTPLDKNAEATGSHRDDMGNNDGPGRSPRQQSSVQPIKTEAHKEEEWAELVSICKHGKLEY